MYRALSTKHNTTSSKLKLRYLQQKHVKRDGQLNNAEKIKGKKSYYTFTLDNLLFFCYCFWCPSLTEPSMNLCPTLSVYTLINLYINSQEISSSVNQDKEFQVEVRRGKEKKVKPLFNGILGWVFWLASAFKRAWHRHRVVLACTPYGWVTDIFEVLLIHSMHCCLNRILIEAFLIHEFSFGHHYYMLIPQLSQFTVRGPSI